MNRYIAGGLLAALALLVGSGLNNLGGLLPDFNAAERPRSRQVEAIGTSPMGQAGRVVQRQSEEPAAVPDAAFQNFPVESGRMEAGTPMVPQSIPTTEISPEAATNAIPRPGEAPSATSVTGDVSPIQPELIQPGTAERPGIDQDLDSIPALW